MPKIAIVTGNRQGLGKAISERLLELDYQAPQIIASQDYDLTQAAQAQRLIQETIETYGKLDLLVNNIGTYQAKSIDDLEIDEWQDMIATNLNAAFYLSKYALPHLRESKGAIINIGFAGLESNIPAPRIIAYQSAKAGLLALTKGLAKAEAVNQVKINMVSPGTMENSVVHNAMDKIPMGRLAKMSEVVDAVVLLVESEYITSQNLDISGGWGL
ncbi:MAG: SDR family oxidoreductase [Candidatus Melainabacteria bacterium]|jgi:NAD(P)-dependent dehydrogenase (short-subunit alcohol dehydrogenase family)|nr:SDR family oxidoreductase [Candidatus Melainabacteria bacterium]